MITLGRCYITLIRLKHLDASRNRVSSIHTASKVLSGINKWLNIGESNQSNVLGMKLNVNDVPCSNSAALRATFC